MFDSDQAQIAEYQKAKAQKESYITEKIHADYRQSFTDYIAYQKGKFSYFVGFIYILNVFRKWSGYRSMDLR